MKTCPRCGEKNHNASPSCCLCGYDLSPWLDEDEGIQSEAVRPEWSSLQPVLIASSVWGLPALLVPLYWSARSIVRLDLADPVEVSLVAGWAVITYLAGALAAAGLLAVLNPSQFRSPSLSVWMLSGMLASIAGVVASLLYSLQPIVDWWGVDPMAVREAFEGVLMAGGAILMLVVAPLVAVLTYPVVRRLWPPSAEIG